MTNNRITKLFVFLLFLNSWACQTSGEKTGVSRFLPPDAQAQVRDERSVTLALPMSNPYNLPSQVILRPSKKVSIGASHFIHDDVEDEHSSNALSNGDHYEWKDTHSELFFRYFPSESSGFYLGVGAAHTKGEFHVQAGSESETNLLEGTELYSGSYEAIYGGPAFGFNWIWNNGITLGFDLSTRKRFKSTYEYSFERVEAPDSVEEDITEAMIPEITIGTITLGYSF